MNKEYSTIARIFFTWTCVLFLFLFALQAIIVETNQIALEKIEVPRDGIVVVNQNFEGKFNNGSPEHPFATINQALEFISEHTEFSKLLVYPGEYEGGLTLEKGVSLLGIGENVKVISPRGAYREVLKLLGNNYVFNVEAIGGRFTIYIPNTTGSITLNQVKLRDASWFGLTNEGSEELTLKVIKSEIYENASQGLYLNKCVFYSNNNSVHDNGEEGIDLHINTTSTIKNTRIFSNKEGGIETELGNIVLNVENCDINNNQSSGINLQSFEGKSTVILKNNIISQNKAYGIRCAEHSLFVSPYFSKMITVASDNKIVENGKRAIDINCRK